MFREFMEPCEVCSENIATRFNNLCNDCYEMLEEVDNILHEEAMVYSYMEVEPPPPLEDFNGEIPF